MSIPKLIAVNRLSTKGTSIGKTLPNEAAKIVDVLAGGYIGFLLDGDKVILEKVE